MLRRPPTTITITPDDIADFEARHLQRISASTTRRHVEYQNEKAERAFRTRLEQSRKEKIYQTHRPALGDSSFLGGDAEEEEDEDEEMMGAGITATASASQYSESGTARAGGSQGSGYSTPVSNQDTEAMDAASRIANVRERRRAAAAAASAAGRGGDGRAGMMARAQLFAREQAAEARQRIMGEESVFGGEAPGAPSRGQPRR